MYCAINSILNHKQPIADRFTFLDLATFFLAETTAVLCGLYRGMLLMVNASKFSLQIQPPTWESFFLIPFKYVLTSFRMKAVFPPWESSPVCEMVFVKECLFSLVQKLCKAMQTLWMQISTVQQKEDWNAELSRWWISYLESLLLLLLLLSCFSRVRLCATP